MKGDSNYVTSAPQNACCCSEVVRTPKVHQGIVWPLGSRPPWPVSNQWPRGGCPAVLNCHSSARRMNWAAGGDNDLRKLYPSRVSSDKPTRQLNGHTPRPSSNPASPTPNLPPRAGAPYCEICGAWETSPLEGASLRPPWAHDTPFRLLQDLSLAPRPRLFPESVHRRTPCTQAFQPLFVAVEMP